MCEKKNPKKKRKCESEDVITSMASSVPNNDFSNYRLIKSRELGFSCDAFLIEVTLLSLR